MLLFIKTAFLSHCFFELELDKIGLSSVRAICLRYDTPEGCVCLLDTDLGPVEA